MGRAVESIVVMQRFKNLHKTFIKVLVCLFIYLFQEKEENSRRIGRDVHEPNGQRCKIIASHFV